MVIAQSLFKVLKQNEPSCLIDVLAPEWSSSILERMPEVRKAVPMPLGHGQFGLGKRIALGESLRQEQYDQAILLPNSLKSAITPFAAKIPRRTGWRGEMRYGLLNDLRVLDKARYPSMVERFVALALPEGAKLPEEIPHPRLEIKAEERNRALEKHGLKKNGRKVLALCPGAAYGPTKKWPAKHYAALATRKMEEGWSVWIFGAENDRADAEAIRSALSREHEANCHSLAGATSLAEAVDLMSLADAVLSNDSGLMHVAAALDRPVTVVYGSSSPAFTPPLSKRAAIVSLGLDCSPCFKRQCPLGHLDCLEKLGVDRVNAEIDELLQGSPR